MDDLITWLRAQLDDDERKARAVEPLGYTTDLGGNRLDEHFMHGRLRYASEDGMPRHDTSDPAAAKHFAAHDPARVLREVEAKRKIIDVYCEERTRRDIYQSDEARAVEDEDQVTRRRSAAACCRGLEIAVEVLAAAYSDRPGYREEWRP